MRFHGATVTTFNDGALQRGKPGIKLKQSEPFPPQANIYFHPKLEAVLE